jgi:hypothetical protein
MMSCDLTLCNNPNVDRLISFMDESPRNYPRVMDLISGLDGQGGFRHPENDGFEGQGYDQELVDKLKERFVFSLFDELSFRVLSSEVVAARVATVAKDAWQTFDQSRTAAEVVEAEEAKAEAQALEEEKAARQRIRQYAKEKADRESEQNFLALAEIYRALVGLDLNGPK